MVYADISSLYENGEHYDSLYGGASPGNVTPVVPIGPGDPPREDQDPEDSDDLEAENILDPDAVVPIEPGDPPREDQDRPRLPMKKPLVPVSEDPEDPEDLEAENIQTTPTSQSRDPTNEPGQQVLLKSPDVNFSKKFNLLYDKIDTEISLREDQEWWDNYDELIKDDIPVPVNFEELTEEDIDNFFPGAEKLGDILDKYKTICAQDDEGNYEQTNKGDILKSAKNLYEYFNCRIYFIQILPLIVKANKEFKKIFGNVNVASITNLINSLPESLPESKLKNHSITELNLFKDILSKLSTHLENVIRDESFIDQFISKKEDTEGISKIKTLTEKLNKVFESPGKPKTSFFGYMTRGALKERNPQEIIDATKGVIDAYLHKDLLDLTYEIRDLLFNYHLQEEEEAATKVQAKWRGIKARKDKRLKEYIGKYYEKKQEGQAPDAPPQPDAAQVQPDVEPAADPSEEQVADPAAEPAVEDDSPQSNPSAKQRFKEAGEKVIKGKREEERDVKKDLYKGMIDEAEQEKSRLDVDLAKVRRTFEGSPLEKGKEESIKEIIENEKKLYLSFRMKTGEVPLVLSLENDIPTIYYKIKVMTPGHYDGYSQRELDSKKVFDQLGKFFKKIDINNIENDIPLIQEISTKINETKKEMDKMIEKYKEKKGEILSNELNLKGLIQDNMLNHPILWIKEGEKEEGEEEEGEEEEGEEGEEEEEEPHVVRLPPVGLDGTSVYSSSVTGDTYNIMVLLESLFKKYDKDKNRFINGEDFVLVDTLFTKNRHYLDFKKNMLTINRIIDLIEKYNVYIDSYLIIAKYIALEKICNYLIRVYHGSDRVNPETIVDETNLLFKNLITADIIKNYHLNDEMDYSRLFFDGIENTLNSFNQGKINYSIIAQITEKFKPTEEDVPEGVIVPPDVAKEDSDVRGVVVQHPDAATGGGKRRRLTNKKRNRRERTNKKRRSVRKTNRRNTKKERTQKKRILKTGRTPKKNTLKKRRV